VKQFRRWATTILLAVRGIREARFPFQEEQRIQARQARNLRRVVAHAFRYVPYYRDLAANQDIGPKDLRSCEDLAHLPLIDGRTLQSDPASFASTARPLSQLIQLHSTGTAAYGSKIVYWHSRELMNEIVYGERDRSILRQLLGTSHGLVRVSFFHPDSSTAFVSRYRANRMIVPRGLMKTHHLSVEQPFSEIDRAFCDLKPDVAYSYGSFAESYLSYVLDRGHSVALPRVWVFGGDGITAGGREQIESGLPCVLYSTYQAIEVGRIGFECEQRHGYHINADLCHIRLVNEQGNTVGPGEAGEVVISGLYNRGSILLNYRLGDFARWAPEHCSCGRNLPLLHLTGARASSFLTLRDGRNLSETALLHACKEKMREVLQFQVVERAPESIAWRIVLSKDADGDRISQDLIQRSRSVLSPDANIDVEIVDRIALRPGMKLSHIVRNPDGCERDEEG
jgi:phenylacetate-CoA ligase